MASIEYAIILRPDRDEFECEVQKRLADGWQLSGGVSMSYNGECCLCYAQAMIRDVLAPASQESEVTA